jgi:predicted transcriptional regulator
MSNFVLKKLVMTTIDLKKDLLHRIAAINDKSVLDAIKAIIDAKSKPTIYETTSEQRENIQEGQNQIARGESFTNEQVEQEIDKWLKEK